MGREVPNSEKIWDVIALASQLGQALRHEMVPLEFRNAARILRMAGLTAAEEELYFPRGTGLTITDPAVNQEIEAFEKLHHSERAAIQALERLSFAFEQFSARRNRSLDRTQHERLEVFVRRLIEDQDPLLKDIRIVEININSRKSPIL